MDTPTSEFGKGFIYNLILFSKHWARLAEQVKLYKKMREASPDLFSEESAIFLWFNGVSDHLYEIEVPPQLKDTEIARLTTEIQDRGLHFGHGFEEQPTMKDFDSIFEKIEALAILLDQELGVIDVPATWK